MIATPLPASALPATPTPVGTPTGPNGPPATSGQAGDQPQGGFARLLDQAREEPAAAAAAQPGGTDADKPARTRASRSGLPRTPMATAAAAAEAAAAAAAPDHGGVGDAAVATDNEQAPAATDALSQPPATNDAAALLATLAALARPQSNPETAAGGAAGKRGDQDPAQADQNGGTASWRSAQADLRATPMAAAGGLALAGKAADALHPDSPGAAVAAAGQAAAEDTARGGGRGFAAELQALLPPAVPASLAAQAVAAAVAEPAPPSATPYAHGQIAASPGSAAFAPELGATLATFVRDGVQHARLELHPAEMGPLSVQIQLDGQAAQVHLSAQNADTRQALEQAMPQLAGSLREAGLTLSGGGVFEQPRQPQPQDSPAGGRGRGAGEHDGEPVGAHAQPTAVSIRRRGVVDLVA